ncbi:MAG: hypothetical protein QXD23_02260 [Candidatus Micrarchaeaceae archaeon]
MPKEKDLILFDYLELNSLNDLARLAYNFDYTSENIFFDKDLNMLFILGEKVNDFTLVYYIKIKNTEFKTFIKYTPPAMDKKESAEFTNQKLNYDNSSFYINVIPLSLNKLINKKTKKLKITSMFIDNFLDLIKLLLSKSNEDNKLPKLYSFKIENNTYFYGFDLIELHNENKLIFFSQDSSNFSNFCAYNYKENSVIPIDMLGDHQYLYIKLINLKEKPRFLQK